MRTFVLQSLFLLLLAPFFSTAQDPPNRNTSHIGKYYGSVNNERSPQNALIMADWQMQFSDIEEALFALDNAVLQNPTSALALIQRAKFKRKIGMLAEAEQDVQLANRYNPYAADVYGLNGVYGSIKVLDVQPKDAVVDLSLYRRIGYYFDFIDRAYLEEKLTSAELTALTEVVYLKEQGAFDEALTKIDSVLVVSPESAIAYDLQGVLLLETERYKAADSAFSKAVALAPDFAIGWYNYARLKLKTEQTKQADQHLQRALEIEPDLTKAHFDRAMLQKQEDAIQTAIRHYDAIIKLKGENYWEAYLNRGLTKKLAGDYEGALRDLNVALEVDSENALLYFNRANIHFVTEDMRRAISDYTTAIELDKNLAGAYYNRGLAALRINDNLSACNDLQEATNRQHPKAAEMIKYFCME